MTKECDNLRYQLDDLLSEGFQTKEQYENYIDLKQQYEQETGDFSFSIREVTGQLEVIISNRENAFPDLDEGMRTEYIDLVDRLEKLDSDAATDYRHQLGEEE